MSETQAVATSDRLEAAWREVVELERSHAEAEWRYQDARRAAWKRFSGLCKTAGFVNEREAIDSLRAGGGR